MFSQTCCVSVCCYLVGFPNRRDGICSACVSPGVLSTERCFFSSPAREPSVSICPRATQDSFFFFPPFCLTPNTTNTEPKISLLSCYSCRLQARCSLLLSLQGSVIVCVSLCESHHLLCRPIYITLHIITNIHTQWVLTCLQIRATKLQIASRMRSCLASSIIHQRKNFKWCQNLFKKRSFFFFCSC